MYPNGYYEPQGYTWSHDGTNTKLNRDKEIVYVPYPVYIPVYYPPVEIPCYKKYPIITC